MKHPNDKKLSDIKSKIESVIPIHLNLEWEKINPMSFKEIINSNPDPIKNILNPWLPEQGLAIIYAEAGVGKTLFTLNVAYAISGGGNFLSFSAPLPKNVLYIDGEMAYAQIHSRFMQIVNQQDKLDDNQNFYLFNGDKIEKPFRLPKISNLTGQEFYNKKIEECNAEVIFFDNLSCLAGIDESDVGQWQLIQDWFLYLRSIGKSVVLVHHSGKDKKGYRGTSKMIDCMDTAISLQKVTQDQLECEKTNSTKFKITYQKNRTFGGKDAYEMEISLSYEGWNSQSIEKTNLIRIVDSLNEGVKQFVIAKEMNVSAAYVSKMAKLARKLKLLKEPS